MFVGTASSGSVNTILQVVVVVFIGLLALACLGALLFSAIAFSISRLGGDAAPRTRRLLARIALARSADTLREASKGEDDDSVSSGLAAIKARDPLFDPIAIVEAARRGLFFAFVMQTAGERQRLEQVTTDEFWQSPVGLMLARQADAQEQIRAMRARRRADHDQAETEPGQAETGADTRGTTLSLDFHAGEATFRRAQVDDHGLDRVTLRIGYVGRGVVTGSVADLQIAARNKTLWQLALGASGAASTGPAATGLAQSEQRGWYDWEFVRSVGSRTATGGEGRRCHNCGAPFRSDLDAVCGNCHVTRVTPEGEWLLARSWLIVA